MTELQGEQVEMENRGVSNEDDQSEKRDFERKLKEVLTEGDIDNMRDKLTPRALTKCKTNALLMAMEVNFELRRKAGKKGPDEEDFTKLANSVDEFTSCLLDPLKSKTEDRHAFGNSLDYLLDVGIEKEQKKFFAHPVMYNLMRKKWFGPFEKLKRSSWLEVERWTWLFLNIWCLFDIILFPFLFTLFYIKHRINKVTRRSKEIDLAFVINATSDVADEAFKLMKNTIKYLMYKFKHRQVKYHILVHGEDSSSREICFTNESCDFRSLSDKVDQLTKNDNVNIPKLHENLKKVGEAFTLSKSKRPCSEKVLVLLTDHQTTREDKKHVEEEVKEVTNMGVNIVPVGMGPRIDIQELKKISGDGHKILHFGEYANPKTVGNSILHELQGKDLVESYREYFTTPYFVFIRDTLSYLTLLGLHVALCLETSSIPFSGLEWAILVFFLGRILMESRQFLDVKIQRKDQSATTTLRGSKYQSCSETEGEERRSATKAATLLKRCNKYLSDRWNILDFITILNYLVTFVLRVVTWSLSESVTDNRALVIAGYLYGLNTMFLTLRAFGHVMETVKGIGAIQIALFHIIGDITTIFWQFVAAILAFSIAITKVYMAERSFISNNNDTESACKSSSGFTCWWSMMKHLTWSLLGIAELDPLDSVDSASVTLVHFLYGAFLIMGVILLVNMMIALLSNTYQRVEEIERNRQMANQIAYTTFAAKGVNDDAFPTGPKAWQSEGIRVQGCLLTYEGSELCSICKDDPAKYHGARYKLPFSPDSPHFEVLIQETGERRLLGVGVVGNDYGNHAMPGWFKGTVGYHIDDGRIFDAEYPTRGKEHEDAMAHRGDLIGCTVRFDLAEDGKVPVVFSLNGRQMTQNEISMDYTHKEKFLYPYIGMGYPGLRVLAKMSSCQDVKKVPNETQDKDLGTFNQNEEIDLMSSCHDVKKGPNEIQDKDQIQKEELDLILETLVGMASKLNSSVRGIKNAVYNVDDEVRSGNTRLSGLADEIITSIQILQDKIISEIKRKKEKCPSKDSLSIPIKPGDCLMMQDRVMREDISFLCGLAIKKSKTKVEVIKEIRKNITDLDKTIEVELREVVTALQETVKNSRRHGDNQDKRRENVKKKFHEHEQFIRTNLLELI